MRPVITHTNKQKVLGKNADYTVTVQDIIQGYVIVCDTTASDVVITLPLLSTLPADSILRSFAIGHSAGDYDIILMTNATDSFVYSSVSKSFNLGHAKFHFTLAGVNTGSAARWGFQNNVTIKCSGHRDSNWAASNFSSMTIIPWDAEAYNNNTDLLKYTSGASARYTVKTNGSYKLSYFINIDSTGGGTWNATATIYKNGVAVDTSEVRTGNYGSEDQTMACVPFYLDLVEDDYVDLRIDQNNLTGNLVHSVFNMELTL